MQIAKLEVKGLKSRDQQVAPARLNLITGPVGSGKSTILDALAFAALGYVPRLGKSLTETARLMRDDSIEVFVALADGTTLGRRIERDGKSLTRTPMRSTVDPKGRDAEHSDAIVSLFGRGEAEAAENIDLRQLFACSPNERAAKLEKLVSAGAMTLDAIATRVYALAVAHVTQFPAGRMPADPEAARPIVDGLLKTMPEAQADAMRSTAAHLKREITDLLSFATDRLGEDRASCSTMRAAHSALETRRAGIPNAVGDLNALEAARDGSISGIAIATNELARIRDAEQAMCAGVQKIDILIGEQQRAQLGLTAAIDRIAEATDLEVRAEAIVDPMPVALDAMDTLEPEWTAAEKDLAATPELLPEPPDIPYPATPEIPPNISAAVEDALLTMRSAELEAAKASPWREVETIAQEIEANAPVGEVPFGFAKRVRDRLFALAATHGGDLHALKDRVAFAAEAAMAANLAVANRNAAIAAAQSEVVRLVDVWRDARKDRTRTITDRNRERTEGRRMVRAAIAAARARVDEVNAARVRAYEIAKADYDGELRQANLSRTNMRTAAAAIRRAAIEAQTRCDAAGSALAEARARLCAIPTGDQVALTLRIETLTKYRDGHVRDIENLQRASTLKLELNKLLDRIERADAACAVWAAVQAGAKQCRAEDLEARSKGLVGRMGAFLTAAGRTETPYIRAGKGVCDFGWIRDLKEISVEALSGGEAVLFTAAMAAAVIATRAPAIKLLCLEAAELGAAESAHAILRGCEALAGEFDHVFVATCADVPAPDGWQVVSCAAQVM